MMTLSPLARLRAFGRMRKPFARPPGTRWRHDYEDAYDAGYSVGKSGESRESCPYSRDSEEHEAWTEGWDEANRERLERYEPGGPPHAPAPAQVATGPVGDCFSTDQDAPRTVDFEDADDRSQRPVQRGHGECDKNRKRARRRRSSPS
jgi:ribosome modulation factor